MWRDLSKDKQQEDLIEKLLERGLIEPCIFTGCDRTAFGVRFLRMGTERVRPIYNAKFYTENEFPKFWVKNVFAIEKKCKKSLSK